ncbi:response regulator [Pantoea endophytica]
MMLFIIPLFVSASPKTLSLLPHTVTSPVQIHPSHETLPWLLLHGEIRVGTWLPAHPPFTIDTDSARFEGLTADYIALLQQALPVRFSIIQFTSQSAALKALRSGEIDLIPGDQFLASNNPDLDSTVSYLRDRAVLLHQSALTLNESDTLAGKMLVYIGDDWIRKSLQRRFPGARLAERSDYYSAIAEVANDENVVMWINEVTAAEINERIYEHHLSLTPLKADVNQSLNFIGRRTDGMLIAAIDDVLGSVSMQNHAQIADAWRLGNPTGIQHIKLALSEDEKAWIALHPVLPVLIVNSHIPLTFTDDDGQVSGYAIALLKKIAQQSGLQYKFQAFKNLADMREHLKKHPDSLIAVANAAASQDPTVIFSRPYQISSWVLVTRKNFPAVKSLGDMAGKKIAVFTGSHYLPELRANYPQVDFVESDFSLGTALSMLAQNIDGAIVPQSGASFVLKSYLSDRFKIATMLPIEPLKLAMATNKNNAMLISIINKALVEIPPRTMDAQLTGWQMRYALDRFEVWGRYRNAIFYVLGTLVFITLVSVFYFWRNRFLRRNLAVQEKLHQQLESAKQQVEKASESKSIFLSQMSHEIRTPLNALIGLLELECRGKSAPEQRENNLNVAWDSAKSLLMLVGDILDMAKIESGTFSVRSIPVSLSEVMNSVTTLFRYSAEEKKIALHTRVEVVSDRILFDPIILKQILSNLLSNAIKFTEQGEVEAVIYQAAKKVNGKAEYVLEVTDSGPGLSLEQQEAIFEPFVQVGDSLTAHRGTGLGLSICRQLASLLKAELQVESVLCEGTTFIFRFAAEADNNTQLVSESAGQLSAVLPCKILVADDHPPNRLLLSQQLAFAGHNCVTAENGLQALQIWKNEQPPFDLVITDCNMPGMSGFELARQLRILEKQHGYASQPIFGLTAMAEQEVIVRAKASGMTDCLFKPLQLERLLARISQSESSTESTVPVSSGIILSVEKLARSQPEMFQQFIRMMIEQNHQDVMALQQAVTNIHFNQIRQRAHSLKGAALLIDASTLAASAEQLELAVAEGDLPSVKRWADQCIVQANLLEEELKRELSERRG